MLGEILKKARESRNLTVADIEKETSIRKAYISALEEENWFALPSPVYVKGFIRNYANFLEIDSDSLVEEYTTEVQGGGKKDTKSMSTAAEGVVPPDVFGGYKEEKEKEKEDIPIKLNTKKNQRSGKKSVAFVFLLLLALVVVGGFYYMNKNQVANAPEQAAKVTVEEKTEEKTEPKAEQPVTTAPKVEEAKPVENKEAAALPAPAPTTATPASQAQQSVSGVEVTAGFNGNCWTQVIVDGVVVFEDIGQDGQFFTWKGNDTIAIIAGNAGAIDITHNGKKLGVMGGNGQVAEKVFVKGAAN